MPDPLPGYPELSERFLLVASHPERLTPGGVWRVLDREERATALTSALQDPNRPWLREALARLVQEHRGGFRISTIKAWPDEQLGRVCAALDIDKVGIIEAAIVGIHLPGRAHLQAAFFDALGIPHVEGVIEGDLRAPAADPAACARAAALLLQSNPTDEGLYYLLALAGMWPQRWPGVREWATTLAVAELARRAEVQAAVAPPAGAAVVTSTAVEDAPGAAVVPAPLADLPPIVIQSETARLSPLDDQLLQTIVQVKAEIQGAPSQERMDAIVDEFTRLNASRHQSFHLVGYRDALFGIPAGRQLPATNVNRRRWYYAGLVAGLRRENREAEIVALFRAEPVVRSLGNTGTGPSAAAAHHVFAALCHEQEFEQACGFIHAEAVYHSDPVVAAVLQTGTMLLRDEQPALAAPMFDVLWQGLARRKEEGRAVDSVVWADVRRRRAHCLRAADDLEGARALLLSLLADPTDANRPAVLVDLGLMDAGHRRLAELQLPADDGDRRRLAGSLAAGDQRFREAAELKERTRSHGMYVIGFRQLLEQEYAKARANLEVALADFGQRPEVYSGGDLLARARLHLGLALCLSVPSAAEMRRGTRLLTEAVEEGLVIPSYLIGDLFLALETTAPDLAAELAERLHATLGAQVLDAAADTMAARRSRVIATALVDRARSPIRSLTARTADWLRALPALLAQDRLEEAEAALDALEVGAMAGVLVEQVQQVLADEREYGPAWTVDEAAWSRARLAEGRGEYPEAAAFLEQVFHRALARGDAAAADDAREVLEQVADFGDACGGICSRLEEQFERRFAEPPAPRGPLEPGGIVHVLVVGGNEVQARFDQGLKTELNHTHPHIHVEFLHTGWDSNWAPHLEDFQRRLPDFQAVVISRYMRTMLGRRIRKSCTLPWRGCGGRGRAAFKNSILAAAEFARRHAEVHREA